MTRRATNNLIARMSDAELRFMAGQFLAPAAPGIDVTAEIDGVRYALAVKPAGFAGWGVFRPLSQSAALLMRPATAGERRQFLAGLPELRLIITRWTLHTATAVIANDADTRFALRGVQTVHLPANAWLFDTIVARWDGAHLWYDRLDGKADVTMAMFLREQLQRRIAPARVNRPVLTPEQRRAYIVAYGSSRLSRYRRSRSTVG